MASYLNITSWIRKLIFDFLMYSGICLITTGSLPIPQRDQISTSESLGYLVDFGYLEPQNPKTGALRSEDSFVAALKHFQVMAAIPITGKLDNATKYMMSLPRCGNKDDVHLGVGARRKKRYALQGSKWAKKDVTFKISEFPRGLTRDSAEKEVYKALKVWGDVTPLNFVYRPFDDRVDIDVRFARRNHGDGNPFDGRGRTLAHAFFPQYGGDAHFDDDEQWTINLTTGVNMFQVAAHEFGHSLGLSHSDVSSALMAPFYRGYQRQFKLDRDDISAIQELYGAPRSKTRAPPRTPVTTKTPPSTKGPVLTVPKICLDSKIDAVTMNSDGQTYIFKGKNYYRLNSYGIAQGYPRPIEQDWKGLTGPIDSALHWDNGYTYIFKGEYYWKFYNFNLIYVRHIQEGFKGIPSNIDASFVWGGNGKTYFVKGNQYWRYTVNHVDPDYPKPMSVWKGLPPKIDAALKWKNGRTYFFSGDRYYRYNDVDFNIDNTYPRTTSNWWLGCPDREQINQIHRGSFGSLHDQPQPDLTTASFSGENQQDKIISSSSEKNLHQHQQQRRQQQQNHRQQQFQTSAATREAKARSESAHLEPEISQHPNVYPERKHQEGDVTVNDEFLSVDGSGDAAGKRRSLSFTGNNRNVDAGSNRGPGNGASSSTSIRTMSVFIGRGGSYHIHIHSGLLVLLACLFASVLHTRLLVSSSSSDS